MNIDIEQDLLALGARRLIIADDEPLYIAAAQAAFKSFSQVQVQYFTNSKEAIEALRAAEPAETLVLTDRCMEDSSAGLRVFNAAITKHMPCIILTGDNGDPTRTLLLPGLNPRRSIVGRKSEPTSWVHALRYLFFAIGSDTSWTEFFTLRKEGVPLDQVVGDLQEILTQQVAGLD